MKLTLIRKWYTNKSTIGELFIYNEDTKKNEFFCHTLEDVVRTFKISCKTAIDSGIYKVILTMSNRFKEIMPLLLDVNNFTGIRMHYGNRAKDTAGCILVGIDKGKDVIYNSRKTFGELMEILQKENDITIEILETYGPYKNDFKNKED